MLWRLVSETLFGMRTAMNPLDQLPDFERFTYAHITPPSAPKLIAWKKAREAERRMALYVWVERNNDPNDPKHRVLLNDTLSAFVLAFEAAIQHAKTEYKKSAATPNFDAWLANEKENDVIVKGVRTLRHLDAHVESYPVARVLPVELTDPPVISPRRWSFQSLSPNDIGRLDRPELKTVDLQGWNAAVQSKNTTEIMGSALDSVNALLLRLESIV